MTHRQTLPPGIHIILGDSAAGSFKQAFDAADRLLIDRDWLSAGPTPPRTNLAEWQRARQDFWFGDHPDGLEELSSFANLNDNIARLVSAGQINLWTSTSVTEQLFIVSTLQLLEFCGGDAQRVRVITFDRTRTGGTIRAAGEINPEQFQDFPEPQRLSPQELDDYRAAWSALSSPEPSGIDGFANRRPNANAHLKRAIEFMKRRYPSRASGLSHFDMRLLRAVRTNPNAARVIGRVLVEDSEDGDFVGDSWLFDRMYRMHDLPTPLLTLTPRDAPMRETQVTLTPFGLDVLEGRASSYPTNPIDDWVGGVRLSSRDGSLWFNDGGRLIAA